MERIIILTGPSCVGKSPLFKALRKFYPELAQPLHKIIFYNSRSPRPGEVDGVDYRFRPPAEVQALAENADFLYYQARNDHQAVSLDEIRQAAHAGGAFLDVNPKLALKLRERLGGFALLEIFLAPLNRAEIEFLRGQEKFDFRELVTDLMRRKLLRRTQRHKGILALSDLEEIEKRAGSASEELRLAHEFQWVLPNHDGEDSDNWDAFYYPLGDARRTLQAFADLLRAARSDLAEKWPANLI